MGATTFQNSMGGPKMNAALAYRTLCDAAIDFNGSDSYNGTISTTSGFRMVEKTGRKFQATIDAILDNENSDIDKWGPAGCIELTGAELQRWKKHNPGVKGRRNVRAFIFFGWAAE